MFRLQLFGGLSLLGETGPLAGPATQRRRLALLARLAASPGATASRDKLIGCFWAEEERERARHHLADSVFTLRKSLGKDVVLTVGDDLVFNVEEVSCDLWDFERALAADEPERAVDLYRGPFLDGFFIGDAPEFERWVEEERAHLAGRYAGALERLALAGEAEGDAGRAVRWWKRLAAHDPFSSRVALRLMQALARAGERAAALQHAKVHAALLREEYDLPPDGQVEAFTAELAAAPAPPGPATSASGSAQPASAQPASAPPTPAVPPTGGWAAAGSGQEPTARMVTAPPPIPTPGAGLESDPAPALPATSAPPAAPHRSPRPFRRRALVALSLLLLTVLAALVRWTSGGRPPLWLQGAPEAPPPEVITIAVMPFDYRGSPEYAQLGAGMVTLLTTSLDGAGEIRTSDPYAILSRASESDDASPLPLDEAAAIATDLEAGYFLSGTLVESGGRLEMAASLYPAGPQARAIWTASAAGAAIEVGGLVDEIVRALVVEQLDAPADRLTRLAVNTTASLPALKAYLLGEQEFRAARYPRAAEALERAVREDSSFALAYYRLSMAEEWSFRFREAEIAADRARARAHRLSPRGRRLITAWQAFVRGDPDLAERLYDTALAEDPFDVEALSGLGEVRMHYNHVRGRPIDEALPAFQQILELAPNFGEARFHLLEVAAGTGNVGRLDSLLAGVDRASPQRLSWLAARAAAWPEGPRSDSVLRLVRAGDDVTAGVAAVRAAVHFRDLEAGEELARLLARPERAEGWRAAGHIMIAQGHLARGEWADADAELDAAMDAEPGWALEMRALGLLLPHASATPEDLRRVRAELEEWDPRRLNPETTFFFATHADVHAELRLYLLALLSLRLGDEESATKHATELREDGRYTDPGEIGSALLRSIEAHRAWQAKDPVRTLRLLEGGQLKAPLERIALSPFFAQSLDRYLRAEAAAAVGRPEEALRWYRSLLEGPDLLFWAAAERRRNELLR